MVGGGSLPEESLPTKLLAISGSDVDVTSLARRLRLGDPPVVARVERDTLLLDPRTVDPADDATLVSTLFGPQCNRGPPATPLFTYLSPRNPAAPWRW